MLTATPESYREVVTELAARAVSTSTHGGLPSSDDIYEFVDETVEDALDHPLSPRDHERIVSFSDNPEAFSCWEPDGVREGTSDWWRVKAFHAMTHDIYDLVRTNGHPI